MTEAYHPAMGRNLQPRQVLSLAPLPERTAVPGRDQLVKIVQAPRQRVRRWYVPGVDVVRAILPRPQMQRVLVVFDPSDGRWRRGKTKECGEIPDRGLVVVPIHQVLFQGGV